MAEEKRLSTRIQNKYDILDKWSNSSLVLKAGEIAFATIDVVSDDGSQYVPTVVMKVGDGSKTFAELPWAAARASDVYSWAKAKNKPTYSANEITGISDYIAEYVETEMGISVDTDTQYQIVKGDNDYTYKLQSKGKGDSAWAEVSTISIPKYDDTEVQNALAAVNATVEQHSTSLTGIAGALDNLSSNKADKATTLAGYGITDAYTKDEVNTEISNAISDSHDTLAGIYATQEALAETNKTVELHTTQITGISGAIDQLWNKADVGSSTDASSANTIYGAKKYAEEQVDALEEDMGSVDGLSTTNKTVVGAINEVLAAVGTGGTAAVVTVEKSADGLTYTVKQGNATVGTIDIPKDMVVTAGEVVTNPVGQAEGTYIKLTLANVTDPLYINVGTLVDIYKAKANATQVQVAIDSATREISATIVAGSIGTTELADNAVVTAKIADANVTKSKLSTEVQASLTKVDGIEAGAEVNIIETVKVNGVALTPDSARAVDVTIPTGALASKDKVSDTDLSDGLYTLINDKANASDLGNAVSRIGTAEEEIDALQADSHWHTNKTVLDYITADLISKWNGAVQTISTPADADGEPNGLKAVKTGTDVAISIDDSITWIFDCGNSSV